MVVCLFSDNVYQLGSIAWVDQGRVSPAHGQLNYALENLISRDSPASAC